MPPLVPKSWRTKGRAGGLAAPLSALPHAQTLGCTKNKGSFHRHFPQHVSATHWGADLAAHSQAGTHRNEVLTLQKGIKDSAGGERLDESSARLRPPWGGGTWAAGGQGASPGWVTVREPPSAPGQQEEF